MKRTFQTVSACSYYYTKEANVTVNEMSSKKYMTPFIVVILLLSSVSTFVFSDSLTVNTDKDTYEPGASVRIYGLAESNTPVNLSILLSSEVMNSFTVTADENGFYEKFFRLASNANSGEYTIITSFGENRAETQFNVEPQTCQLATNLIRLAEASKLRAEKIMSTGTQIPEGAMEVIKQANEALEEAHSLREEGECKSASAKANKAIQLFGKATRNTLESSEPEEEDVEAEQEAAQIIGLRVSIERNQAFLNKLYEIATGNEEKGLDITEIKGLLLEANTALTQAETLLENGDIQAAHEENYRARDILDRAMRLLQSRSSIQQIEKASDFLDKTEDRLQELQERTVNMLSNLPVPPEAIEGINEAFRNGQQSLHEVRNLIEKEDMDAAMNELNNVIENTNGVLETLDEYDDGRGTRLRTIKKIEAKIDYLNEKISNLKTRFKETSALDELQELSDLEDMLIQAGNLLNQALSKLSTGDIEDVQTSAMRESEAIRLIWDAEEITEKVDDLIVSLEVGRQIEQNGWSLSGWNSERQGLSKEIEALEEEIAALEKMLNFAGEEVDVSKIEDMLWEAREILSDIRSRIMEDIQTLENLLTQVRDLVDSARDLIKDMINSQGTSSEVGVNQENLSEGIRELEEELSALMEQIEKLRNSGVDVQAAIAQLHRLRTIIDYTQNPELEHALAEQYIEQAKHLIEEIKEILNVRALPGSVVDVAVEYVLDKYPQLKLDAPEEWTMENLTPPGLVGYTTTLYAGGGWAVKVGSAAVAEPRYEIEIEHTGEMRFSWKGTIDQDWNVDEKEFTISQN